MVSIVRMAQPDEGGAIDHPRPERLVRGNPRRETWPLYETADGVTSVGIWACEVGMWRIVFAPNKEEYFFVLEGHVRLHAREVPRWTCAQARAPLSRPASRARSRWCRRCASTSWW